MVSDTSTTPVSTSAGPAAAEHPTPGAGVRISPLIVPTQPGAGHLPGFGASAATTAEPSTRTVGADVPAPRLRTLIGICGWAALLGGVGLIIGIRGFWGIAAGDAPGWYEPTIVTLGLIGIFITIGSFLTAHRDRVPWILLGCASVSLITGMIITTIAF